jgi:hypothetical protein
MATLPPKKVISERNFYKKMLEKRPSRQTTEKSKIKRIDDKKENRNS